MRATVIFVTNDLNIIQKAREQYETDPQIILQIYTGKQWADVLENDSTRAALHANFSNLTSGGNGNSEASPENGRILTFPTPYISRPPSQPVEKMDQMEAKAIESAISQYNGNLTEAAKALGIGRATLYRKVKQYQIDPNLSRRRRVA
jgi:transcriptional regulator of acetoin/glycerol metabolism